MVGFLKRVRNAGRVGSSWTIRTVWTCFGRRRSTAAFNVRDLRRITRDNSRQTTNARALNPPSKRALTPIAMSNGSQIALSLRAAMNRSSAGLVHF